MNLRTLLGSLQLPIAGFGVLLVSLSAYQLATLPPSPPNSDGFVEGLAAFFLLLIALVGFVVASLGLAIPPGDGFGIRFNRWQRRLFVGAAVCALLSVLVPLVFGTVLVAAGVGVEVLLLFGTLLATLAVFAFVTGIGWRGVEAATVRLRQDI